MTGSTTVINVIEIGSKVFVGPDDTVTGGVLAGCTCGWLAAVFLHADAVRDGEAELAAWFRTRALVMGVVVGVVGAVGELVLRNDAPTLASGLHGRALPVVLLSAVAGVAALVLVAKGRAEVARFAAPGAVAGIVVAWGVAQYPWLLVDELTIFDGAASTATLVGVLVAFALAGLLVIPALVWLLRLTDRGRLEDLRGRDDSSAAVLARSGRPSH
jgi:cytochrome d ubiquinol oxidase subunit II